MEGEEEYFFILWGRDMRAMSKMGLLFCLVRCTVPRFFDLYHWRAEEGPGLNLSDNSDMLRVRPTFVLSLKGKGKTQFGATGTKLLSEFRFSSFKKSKTERKIQFQDLARYRT